MAALDEYRRKRDPARTPEPIPDDAGRGYGAGNSFVVQEHHATALHWDFRLERDGVLVSWAVPKGVPTDPKVNRLAVRTEDHPLEYVSFEGTIRAGEYGGGTVLVWDHGSYEVEKWTDSEVKFTLSGTRLRGRFVLFRTGGKNWMMHRMDAAASPDWLALPDAIAPMLATLGTLPPAAEDAEWGYEMKWDGVRAVTRIEGGRVAAISRNDADMTVSYPELRALGAAVGATQLVLDGEIVSFDPAGRPSFGRLQKRMHVTSAAAARQLAAAEPITYLIFDVLHHEGRSLLEAPYSERRALLDELDLNGTSWQTPSVFEGGGADAVRVSQEQQLEGVVAKRLTSRYLPGRRSPDWIKIKNIRTQEVVIGGWREGRGARAGMIGALLLGIPGDDGLTYVGKVGTGFTVEVLESLAIKLGRLKRSTMPFVEVPRADAKDARWVSPTLVGEVAFTEWTADARLRHPAWRGLRADKTPHQVIRE